jgi:PEP-CTERM motif-containing protein
MNRKSNDASRSRIAVIGALALSLGIAFFGFATVGSNTAHATAVACPYYDCGNWVIPHSGYALTNGPITFPGASPPLELRALDLVGPMQVSETVPLPQPGSSAQPESVMFGQMLIDLGPGTALEGRNLFADLTFPIANNGAGGGTTYDTQMLGLSVAATYVSPSGPIPFLIRESPTLGSTGQHTLSALPTPGTFQVDSFFDVFVELSLDNGQTFYPGSSPIHLDLQNVSPEPASMVMAGIGFVGVAAFVRRQRLRWRNAS